MPIWRCGFPPYFCWQSSCVNVNPSKRRFFRLCTFDVTPRVPGLPITNCAGSCNNLVPRDTKMSAKNVTPKVSFERSYWFQDSAHLSSESTIRFLPHPHCYTTTISRFLYKFFRMWPLIFLSAHYSPSNLAKSWYPHHPFLFYIEHRVSRRRPNRLFAGHEKWWK